MCDQRIVWIVNRVCLNTKRCTGHNIQTERSHKSEQKKKGYNRCLCELTKWFWGEILENNMNVILFDIDGFVQMFFSKFFNELLRVAGYNGKNLQKCWERFSKNACRDTLDSNLERQLDHRDFNSMIQVVLNITQPSFFSMGSDCCKFLLIVFKTTAANVTRVDTAAAAVISDLNLAFSCQKRNKQRHWLKRGIFWVHNVRGNKSQKATYTYLNCCKGSRWKDCRIGYWVQMWFWPVSVCHWWSTATGCSGLFSTFHLWGWLWHRRGVR